VTSPVGRDVDEIKTVHDRTRTTIAATVQSVYREQIIFRSLEPALFVLDVGSDEVFV
jgi:hypothetical protein